jgi:hypothetical protein
MTQITESGWRVFDEQVLPPFTAQSDRKMYRRAFYAGAQTVLAGMVRSLDPSGTPTDADVRRMVAIGDEIDAFFKDVERGRA